jgi:hypothetical protein
LTHSRAITFQFCHPEPAAAGRTSISVVAGNAAHFCPKLA